MISCTGTEHLSLKDANEEEPRKPSDYQNEGPRHMPQFNHPCYLQLFKSTGRNELGKERMFPFE